MKKPPINTTKQAFPQIYAYTTPGVTYHDGWTKIGYTEHKDARTRIDQQTVTADIHYQLEWSLPAIYDDGSFDIFKDTDFHTYLEKKGIGRLPGKEWFHIAPPPAKNELRDFKENRGLIVDDDIRAYRLRAEQQEAVSKAKDYFLLHERGEFLWNAKPRFGKTLASYDLCKQLDARNVLIVTNRPAIANSWYDDYCKFLGVQSDYLFVSNAESLNGNPTTYKHVKSREEFDAIAAKKKDIKRIEFISLQDLKGARRFGGNFQKLNHVAEIDWDLLIIDEAHEGIDTYRTDVAFDHIKRKHTLHLSGTPFKALASNKFAPDAIYNWTYADEQKAKRDWASEENDPNPYEDLPRLNLFTYQMSEIVREQVAEGVEIDGEKQEYAFDLNEFFEVNPATKRFVHDVDVNRFLDALATQEKFPFSTEELRTELKHTLWILNRVDSAKALINKLRHHDVFKDYKIVPAIGDGRIDENDVATKSYDAVRKAIRENPRTITISVGQLTTGVTIPEWTGVLMLSNMKSPSLYMQAAFRCQNPCLFKVGSQYLRKKDSYVFDFDPARTLIIFEEFANDLSADTSGGRGDTETRKKHIKELLNFFPVYGEDPDGEMVELDAEKVLTIPRKLKSREVVNHGFMSNYLFQNISAVFSAPLEVIEKIKQLTPAKDPGAMGDINKNTKEELSLNDDGEVDIPNEQVIGTATELFGDKIYGDADDFFYDMSGDEDVVDDDFDWFSPTSNEIPFDSIKDRFKTNYIEQMLDAAKKTFGDTLKESTKSDLNRKMSSDADSIIKHNQLDHKIEKAKLLEERDKALDKAKTDAESEDIERQFEQKAKELARDFEKKTISQLRKSAQDAGQDIVRQVITDKKEAEKREKENSIKDHLRGFSRTIPSFLMAYGDYTVTLENFDNIIPPEVFKEVTSITIDDFRLLRDGGDVTDADTGEVKHFDGHLFDPVVFNDSVKEFLARKKELANYFDEEQKEDIFDYIPPQKTNQIFTPRRVVIDMLDRLEAENPGCFDDPDKTFADFYMKSGMYITEIVKRLYKSENMKRLFPDSRKRLEHIFEKQVFGLAPTEIIYRITLSYILGFSDDFKIEKHNIRKCDSLVLMKKGMFETELMNMYGGVLTHE